LSPEAGGGRDDSFRLLFEAAPDAILVVDAKGLIRLNNVEAERLLEAAPGELKGLSVERLVPMSARRGHTRLREGFHEHPRRRPMGMGLSLKAVKLTGREFPVEISLAPATSEHGSEVIVILRDVSERLNARRTERELVRAKALTRITQLAIRAREFDPLVNEALQHCHGPLAADLVLLIRRGAHDDAARVELAFGPVAAEVSAAAPASVAQWLGAQLTAIEAPMLVGDASTSSVGLGEFSRAFGIGSLIIVPLAGDARTQDLLVAGAKSPHFFTTDDLAFLEAVVNILSNAQQRGAAEERLLMSQRLESLGQLTGGVAHDFNNLLTVIAGNLQILEDGAGTDPLTARVIAAANRATRRGAELTAKLLAFSRRQNLRPAAVALPALLASFTELLARTLGPNIEIAVRAPDDLPAALADPGQLETALLNLAVNARDAMADGGQLDIRASQSAHWDGAAGDYLRIDVADNGAGMSRETLARAFEPFFTTKVAGKGSGLGLSMVYGFAKQSHGHVSASSEPGVGTTVSLFLPAAYGRAAVDDERRDAAVVAGGSERILVIEDDADVRAVAMSFLASLGYQALAASNQRTALRHLRSQPDIALVFSDVVLAGNETGPKVVAALLKIKPDLRVLYTTGYARNALPPQTALDDDVAVLRKPYTRDQLGAMIRQQLGVART